MVRIQSWSLARSATSRSCKIFNPKLIVLVQKGNNITELMLQLISLTREVPVIHGREFLIHIQ